MAYLNARAGIARSGVTYCGWTTPAFTCSHTILFEELAIERRRDSAPDTCTFGLRSIPTLGNTFTIRYTTPNDYLFAGTITATEAIIEAPTSAALRWRCTATGFQWMLNRRLVTASYGSTVAANTMIHDIVKTYTNGGFRVGYAPSSLGTIGAKTFNSVPAGDALAQIATACGAYLEVTPEKIINVCADYPHAAYALTDGSEAIGLQLRQGIDQLRTRARVLGVDSPTTSGIGAGSTTIPVANRYIFAGAKAVSILGNTISIAEPVGGDAGNLTATFGVPIDVPSGTRVFVVEEKTDASAESVWDTAFGSDFDGRVDYAIGPIPAYADECRIRATNDLALHSAALWEVEFTTRKRTIQPNQLINVNITSPFGLTTTAQTTSVRTTFYTPDTSNHRVAILNRVRAGGAVMTLDHYLRTISGSIAIGLSR